MTFIDNIKNKYLDQDIYIIGCGISIRHLTEDLIGDGVIITLNSSIDTIEKLLLSNVVYSMQKDGPGRGILECNDCSKHTIMPNKSILLVHKHESINCSPDYKPRMVFDNEELGLNKYDFSALTAIKMGQIMGCKKFYFISFDACVNGECTNYFNKIINKGYIDQARSMKPYLNNIKYEWIIPKEKIT